ETVASLLGLQQFPGVLAEMAPLPREEDHVQVSQRRPPPPREKPRQRHALRSPALSGERGAFAEIRSTKSEIRRKTGLVRFGFGIWDLGFLRTPPARHAPQPP